MCLSNSPLLSNSAIIVATSWLGAPPDLEEPHCDNPYTNFGVASAQPVLTPGPAILENEPLDMAFPKLSGAGTGSNARSTSTSRGKIAFDNEEVEDVGEVGH